MRLIIFFQLIFTLSLVAQYDVLVTPDMIAFGCSGSIEIITDGEFSPYSIEFDNGLTATIEEGETSFTFEDICPGNYSISIINSISCQKRIENIEVVSTGLNSQCNIDMNIKVLLEGSYNEADNKMTTWFYERGFLPGQEPFSSIYPPTRDSVMYTNLPWAFDGLYSVNNLTRFYDDELVDWVLVSYRDSIIADSTFFRELGLLKNNGEIEFPYGCSKLTNEHITANPNFYIVVEHHNHMAVMSAEHVIKNSGNEYSYDFSLQDSYITTTSFGQKLISGKWMMYAGDIDQVSDVQSSDINGLDKALWQTRNGAFGLYHPGDLNLDADVNGADKSIWELNNGITNRVEKYKE